MNNNPLDTHNRIQTVTQKWLESFVIGRNLCPFAKREWDTGRVQLDVSVATKTEELLVDLELALRTLQRDDGIETLLLIHPQVLQSFDDYNQALDLVDQVIEGLELVGIFQVATFHPDYQFGGTEIDAAENYTNRSPYPMLHLLREGSLERAIEAFDDIDGIPARNIALMDELGATKLKQQWQGYFND